MLRRLVTAATVGAVALVGSADGAAAAVESYRQNNFVWHTYTDFDDQPVDCFVYVGSALAREGRSGPFDGSAYTQVDVAGGQPPPRRETSTGSVPSCLSTVDVAASWVDPAGRRQRASAQGRDTVDLDVAEVGSGFVATHRVSFANCAQDCVVTATTNPK